MAIGGSSLGGLVSLYLGLKHSRIFGKIAALSPSVWWNSLFIHRFGSDGTVEARPRIWLDIGTREGPRIVRDVEKFRDVLLEKGGIGRTCTTSGSKARSITNGLGATRRSVPASCILRGSRCIIPALVLPFSGGVECRKTAAHILCVSSYEKGQEFIRTCKASAATVPAFTVEKLRHADWPFECLDDVIHHAGRASAAGLDLFCQLYREVQADRPHRALDEFDMDNVSALRETPALPGMGSRPCVIFATNWRCARGRGKRHARAEFIHVLNMTIFASLWRACRGVAAQAAFAGVRHRNEKILRRGIVAVAGPAWRSQSFYLLEHLFRARSITWTASRRNAALYSQQRMPMARRPLDTSHHGGVFTTRTLLTMLKKPRRFRRSIVILLTGLGFVRGVTHAEFLKSHADGKFYFIEVAARVGGAYIAM